MKNQKTSERDNHNEETTMTVKETQSLTKDHMSNMTVDEATALHAERDGKTFYFCSDHCRPKFLTAPRWRYAGAEVWRLLWTPTRPMKA